MNNKFKNIAEQATEKVLKKYPELKDGIYLDEVDELPYSTFFITEYDFDMFGELLIQHCIAIMEMRFPRMCDRNGGDCRETVILKRIIKEFEQYFEIEKRDVNDIFNESLQFRKHFKLD